ncbi:MAG TPA: alkaline shock response membrane anchor protein AmaP [Candidatus Omnitrophota bacterium]|nr:alkaline shock response membrane anchor protein AmaP [Candidatus Omnitrophota bacterium]
MKVGNAFAQLFAIFSFLTLGSLLIIMSLHLLAFDDAILRLQEIYQNPWRSVQVGVVGIIFIVLGLSFSKMLVKSGRPNEAVIFHSDAGAVVVSMGTIENASLKALKHFTLVKNAKVKVIISGKSVEVKLRLVLWAGGQVASLLSEMQQEVYERVKRLLGADNQVTVICDVKGIEEVGAPQV